jgi:predicted RNA-binding Zn ribbon-like protein
MDTIATESTRFDFGSGWLCLDFCNTADGNLRRDWKENLHNYEDIILWSREAGIIRQDEAAHLLHSASEHAAETTQTLDKARVLRQTMYDIFSAISAEKQPESKDLAAFNIFLNEAGSHLQIATISEGFGWDWVSDSLEKPLWRISWSAAELLLSEKRELVRECGSETCSWLFLDTSRNHSRRWCDMKGCGNRAKARRHYARSKAAK